MFEKKLLFLTFFILACVFSHAQFSIGVNKTKGAVFQITNTLIHTKCIGSLPAAIITFAGKSHNRPLVFYKEGMEK